MERDSLLSLDAGTETVEEKQVLGWESFDLGDSTQAVAGVLSLWD